MALETVVVAVGRGDDEAARTDALADVLTDLAVPTGADVILLHVFDREGFEGQVSRMDFDSPSDAMPTDVARRHAATRDLGDLLEAEGVRYSIHGEVGDDAGTGIVTAADDLGADLLIVGGRKRSPAGKAVFGSTAQQVMLNANCPVTYVRDD